MVSLNGNDQWSVAIAYNYHDSSVAIAKGATILKALEAERVFGIKKLRCSVAQMDALVQRLLDSMSITFQEVSLWCGTSFGNLSLMEPLEVNQEETQWLEARILGKTVDMFCVNHHRAHAAFYFLSPFDSAVTVSCDGGGDGQTHEVFYGKGLNLTRLERTESVQRFSATLYDRASFHLYKAYRNEGKFMGLSGWSLPDEGLYEALINECNVLCNVPEEEALALFEKLYSLPIPETGDRAQRFAATVQKLFEDLRLSSVRSYRHIDQNLVLTGGAALNVVANTRLAQLGGFSNVWIPPNCDDTGQAVGALAQSIVDNLHLRPSINFPFLGEEEPSIRPWSPSDIEKAVVDLCEGKVIAWHSGRAEVGPRALGNRSLLTAPFSENLRKLVSEEIKGRESYRPVAPIVLEEKATDWFDFGDMKKSSPYMSYAVTANASCKSAARGIVHVDGTARVQTVAPVSGCDLIRELLLAFERKTGVPILVNTSLNKRGVPISNTFSNTLDFANEVNRNRSSKVLIPYFNGIK